MKPHDPLCFDVDAPLGKLARWLRILGFDTQYHRNGLGDGRTTDTDQHRIMLTRSSIRLIGSVEKRRLIRIDHNDPEMQLRQVVAAVPIRERDIRLFSRCLECNVCLIPVEKHRLHGKVPDYIWESHSDFTHCSRCGKFFWPGSHRTTGMTILKRLFKEKIINIGYII